MDGHTGFAMKIFIESGLPFTEVVLTYRGKSKQLNRVIIDTGSVGTLFNADAAADVGIKMEKTDLIHRITG